VKKATNRKSTKVLAGITEAQFQESMGIYAKAHAKSMTITAAMDKKITEIRDKYSASLDDLVKDQEEQLKVIQAYCTENKAQLFAEKRSMPTVHGTVGFRLGTPKLKTLPKWTWDRVLEKLKVVMPDYVRTKSEVDKERLLSDRNDEAVAPMLNEVGVYVDQDEAFFVELKKEESAAEIPA
jgi:phage host-nuclease inhibitor protein Gam